MSKNEKVLANKKVSDIISLNYLTLGSIPDKPDSQF
jgi:hypothetical protein